MLLAMTVLLIVTVMFATMKGEFQVTKLNGEQLARYYVAKAASAEMVVLMAQNNTWRSHLDGAPVQMTGYDPPVEVLLRTDLHNDQLIHIKADCMGETAFRVVRNGGNSDAMLFTAGTTPEGTTQFYRRARRESTRNDGSGGWKPVIPPPAVVYRSDGSLGPYGGDVVASYTADFQGNFYSVHSSSEGFAAYSFAGSAGWERLPPRPQAQFSTTGTTIPGGNYSGTSAPLFDAAKDGSALWFVENVDPAAGMTEGAAYIQKYDLTQKAWTVEDLPKQYALSSDGHFQVADVAVGDSGHTYLLTKPTAQEPARILGHVDGTWQLLDGPPESYYDRGGGLVQGTGTLPVESLTINADNELYVTAATPVQDWFAAPAYSAGQWDMGVERDGFRAELVTRDYAAEPDFEALTTDSSGWMVAGDRDQAFHGPLESPFSELATLPIGHVGGKTKTGGGFKALPQVRYATTAEY